MRFGFRNVAVLTPLLLLALGGPAPADIIYFSDSQGNIGTVNTVTDQATIIGNTGHAMTDIAFAPNGTLYGIDSVSNLYTINPNTGSSTLVGPTHEAILSSLTVNPSNGTIFAAGVTLSGGKISILNPTNGAGTPFSASLGFGHIPAGDLEFANGNLYLTDLAGDIDQINPLNGTLSASHATGHSDISGLAFTDGTLYGLTLSDHLLVIDPTTGATTDRGLVSGLPGGDIFFGATAPFTAPEPTSLTLFALAGLAVAGRVWRGRKRSV